MYTSNQKKIMVISKDENEYNFTYGCCDTHATDTDEHYQRRTKKERRAGVDAVCAK